MDGLQLVDCNSMCNKVINNSKDHEEHFFVYTKTIEMYFRSMTEKTHFLHTLLRKHYLQRFFINGSTLREFDQWIRHFL